MASKPRISACHEQGALFIVDQPIHVFEDMHGRPDMRLLAAIVANTVRDPVSVGQALFRRFGSLAHVFGADGQALISVDGMTPAAVSVILATQVANERVLRDSIGSRTVISSWNALLGYVRVAMAGKTREEFRVLFLDKKNALIADEMMNRGTVDHAPVYPREIIKRALEVDASAIILVHNHPSGDPEPSSADIDMTRQVIEAGRPLRITVHDHLIVGAQSTTSFKALGFI